MNRWIQAQRELDQVVWAPYRLNRNDDCADELGTTAKAVQLRPGDEHLLELQPSRPPSWLVDQQSEQLWADEYRDAPIRLEIECSRDGYAPWKVPIEVDQPQPAFEPRRDPRDHGVVVAFFNTGTAPARNLEITTNLPDAPRLDGERPEVVEPGQSTQTARLIDTLAGVHEWVELSWSDPRGVRRHERVDLRF